MNSAQKNKNLLLSVFTALFAALIAVSGFISVPLPGTPVPVCFCLRAYSAYPFFPAAEAVLPIF